MRVSRATIGAVAVVGAALASTVDGAALVSTVDGAALASTVDGATKPRAPRLRSNNTCVACPADQCRVGCAADLGKPGNAPGSCVACAPDEAGGINYGTFVVPEAVEAQNVMQLGINSGGGIACPCGNESDPCAGPYNATGDLLLLRPAFARTHDAFLLTQESYEANVPWGQRAFNWDDLYPDLAADPLDPASYTWEACDEWASNWDAIGVPMLLRLGASVNQGAAQTAVAMADTENLSTAFVQIVKHYNDGWGGGRPAPPPALKVAYVEVWNEPEGAFWTGELDAYYQLVSLTVSKMRAYDPSLKVGPNYACPYAGICQTGDDGYRPRRPDSSFVDRGDTCVLRRCCC